MLSWTQRTIQKNCRHDPEAGRKRPDRRGGVLLMTGMASGLNFSQEIIRWTADYLEFG